MVHHLLTHHQGVLPLHVRAEARLDLDLYIDSLELLDLAIALEERYGIAVETAALDEAATVADLIRLVERSRFPETMEAKEETPVRTERERWYSSLRSRP
jgi:acyl carrier protein